MSLLLQGNALFALLSAALWGCGDFCGGMGVKRAGGSFASAVKLLLISHVSSLLVLFAIARWRGLPFPHGVELAWGLAAGTAGGVGLLCFYVALSRGAMGASAAVSGLLAAALPAALSIHREGSPGWLRLIGFALAGTAIWMIAGGTEPAGEKTAPSTMPLAVAAGLAFGVYFIALKLTGLASPVSAMAAARVASTSLSGLLLLGILGVQRGRDEEVVAFGWGAAVWAWGTALLDTTGNLLFIAATRAGRLDVAAVLASLYPASTILLAAWTLKERPTRRQTLGMFVAASAVVMIVLPAEH